ncbi:RagB/SusD family nutrient uptake outer membrane protein [Persicobacter psychrovividus]|uniref:Membrane protein n=1 Tax=Persicobacter psychrovividus TaxID=387638 RepID=A0ABN6LC54_9BACT|nr:membrane protein [Persicobacter psychrovividus]
MTFFKHYNFSLFAAVCLLLATSCTKFEDVNPTDEFPGSEVPTSTYNIELVLTQSYTYWSQLMCMDHIPDANVIADHTDARIDGQKLGAYKFRYEYARFNFNNDGLWTDGYNAINLANHVIKYTEGTEEIDNIYALHRNRLRGEALFIRAYANFILLRYYGAQYTTANMDMPGIILRTEPAVGFANGGRATVGEGYQMIKEDLEEAISLIPIRFDDTEHKSFPNYRVRANKFDVMALYARVQLQMNDIDGANETVTTLIGKVPGEIMVREEIAPAGMDFVPMAQVRSLFKNTSITAASQLRPFAANYAVSDPINLMLNMDQITDSQQSAIYLTKSFMNNFMDEKGDFANNDTLRLNAFVKEYAMEDADGLVYDTAFVFNKFALDPTSETNWPLIRLEELLLIRAETWALKGSTSGAIPDINKLRALRGANPVAGSPNRIQAINLVVRERMLEMIGEGERFFHWKRMGAFNETVEQVYSPEVYSTFDRAEAKGISWNGPETLYRLPIAELQRNTDLSEADQNP